jgi:hypothetical protein
LKTNWRRGQEFLSKKYQKNLTHPSCKICRYANSLDAKFGPPSSPQDQGHRGPHLSTLKDTILRSVEVEEEATILGYYGTGLGCSGYSLWYLSLRTLLVCGQLDCIADKCSIYNYADS